MATRIDRPFDNFKIAITDPDYFFGHAGLLKEVQQSPFRIRIVLGGPRLGKTSILRAIEYTLLNHIDNIPSRALPVFISLKTEQPKNEDHFRYLLIARLREAMHRWQKSPGGSFRDGYRQYLSQIPGGEATLGIVKFNFTNIDYERRLTNDQFRQTLYTIISELQEMYRSSFEGVCFILDEADFIVSQTWANNVFSYIRGLKDSDIELKPFFGFILAGYRNLKTYQQETGSALHNIAVINWLTPLSDKAIRQLIEHRCHEEQVVLFDDELINIAEWAGGHPFLVQQAFNSIVDNRQAPKPRSHNKLFKTLLQQHANDFSVWWRGGQNNDGLVETEQFIYRNFAHDQLYTAESIAEITKLPINKANDALLFLAGIGVIRQFDEEQYEIGSRLFKEWVSQLS